MEPDVEEQLKAHQIFRLGDSIRPLIYDFVNKNEKLSNNCYAIKTRVKAIEGLLYKKKDRREKKPRENYQLTDITDVIGVRFVTLFRQQMCDVLNEVLTLLCNSDGSSFESAPFNNAVLHEVIIYKGNSFSDTVFDEINGVISDFPKAKNVLKEANRDEGYSSIHVVAYLAKEGELRNINSYNVPVEIQIRTVFEDAWGEVDHKYGYKGKINQEHGEDIKRTPAILDHLKNLKLFSDASANYANIIHKEVTGSYSFVKKKGKLQSVPSAVEEQLHVLSNINITKGQLEDFSQAIHLLPSSGEVKDKGDCIKARRIFETLLTKTSKMHPTFHYFCSMNYAFCFMVTGEVEDIMAAREIYIGLQVQNDNPPMLLFRLAQSYDKLGDEKAAIEIFDEAWEVLKKVDNIKGKRVECILPSDVSYLSSALPIFIGYNLWKSSLNKEVINRVEILNNAIKITESVFLTSPTEYHEKQAHNNILYYQYEIWRLGGGSPPKEQRLKNLEFIESKIDWKKSDDIQWLDTICKAFQMYNRKVDMKKVANRIIQLVLDGCKTEDPEDTLAILQEAKKCLNL